MTSRFELPLSPCDRRRKDMAEMAEDVRSSSFGAACSNLATTRSGSSCLRRPAWIAAQDGSERRPASHCSDSRPERLINLRQAVLIGTRVWAKALSGEIEVYWWKALGRRESILAIAAYGAILRAAGRYEARPLLCQLSLDQAWRAPRTSWRPCQTRQRSKYPTRRETHRVRQSSD